MPRHWANALLAGAIIVAATQAHADPIGAATLTEINSLYRRLIEAENRHDLAAVRRMVWESRDTLFVAKTATAAEGN